LTGYVIIGLEEETDSARYVSGMAKARYRAFAPVAIVFSGANTRLRHTCRDHSGADDIHANIRRAAAFFR
jgi:hypothetical protein